ncbi:MAG: endopeptidase La [Deltaproteobacteria bacterium]|nr:endopeptidase La [Deltaproteobacteria bacterium]
MNKTDANMNGNNIKEIIIGKGENIEQQDLPEEIQLPEVIPLLPIRDLVLFPFMIIPLFVGREASIKAVDEALSKDRLILLSAQKDIIVEEPSQNDIYDVGVVAMIMKMLKLPDGRVKILVQGLLKAKIETFVQIKPFYLVKVSKIKDENVAEITPAVDALMRNVKEQLEKYVSLGRLPSQDILIILENITNPGRLADIVASNLGLKIDESQKILEETEQVERLKKVNDILAREIEILSMQAKIQSQAKEEMTKTQRDYFLREQLRQIKQELGETDEKSQEIAELREKITAAKMPQEVLKEAEKQLSRLESMHQDAAEASTIRTYLEWLSDIPWSKKTKDNLDIETAKKILDEDHYDLEKIKERILEYLSVRKLNKKMKGPILCFIGPPGVGKTSLGKSIAKAMNRKFIRVSLGGVHDEAEIRGHRRTYVGALPGRVIQGIKQAGTNNPVFMIDEIDKVGTDFRGDPSSALLEVLDPEQNFSFSDHYLNVPFDLSNVMFVATANVADTIPSPLRDRMEIINLSGYTLEEKEKITEKYLIPRQIKENGLKKDYIEFKPSAVKSIIAGYTREAGLRNLEREIGTVCRKVARNIAENKIKKYIITDKNIHKYLGTIKILPEEERQKDEIGVATGLAWTPVGGEVLYIETILVKGKGAVSLTGQLGDVMKESAHAAVSYARSKADELGIKTDTFEKNDIHIHIPEGAIPKDGPSAGITMATSLISAVLKKPVRKDIAMTGEITLRGNVLPIGGLKEKSLAALRAGIKTILIPERNKKDLEDISPLVKKNLKFIPVRHMDEVIKHAIIGISGGDTNVNSDSNKIKPAKKNKGAKKRKVK